MAGVAVVTDTTQYIPREIMERHGIKLVSLYVNWDGRTDRESDLGDYDEFYDHMRTAATLPSTSQPSVGDFLAAYEPLLDAGDDVLSIHLSGGISGTVGAAQQARDALIERGIAPERMQVLDSETGCAGHGLMAIAATNAVSNGANLQGATDAAVALRGQMRILFAVETLGSALKIKPILTIDREIQPIERVRTSGRALQRMVDHLTDCRDAGADVFFIQHIQAHDVATRLVEHGREIYKREPEFVSEIGPVIGAHVGPGLIGVTGLASSALGPV
jgi:fatty acid-binding protein DegV